jgi:acyl-CoA thioesterase-1
MMESDMNDPRKKSSGRKLSSGMSASRRVALRRVFHCTSLLSGLGLTWPAQSQAMLAAAIPGGPRHTVLVVGDSLSAEYGLPRGSGWVALLEQRLVSQQLSVRVVNASISGDTTAGGWSRLPSLLKQHHPTQVIIELGGNDALRGLPLSDTQRNLTEMTRAAKDSGARVLIAGIQVPPNYGRRYNDDLAAVFASVAQAQSVALVPFILEGLDTTQFQEDRIHPLPSAQPAILDNVWPRFKPLLR